MAGISAIARMMMMEMMEVIFTFRWAAAGISGVTILVGTGVGSGFGSDDSVFTAVLGVVAGGSPWGSVLGISITG